MISVETDCKTFETSNLEYIERNYHDWFDVHILDMNSIYYQDILSSNSDIKTIIKNIEFLSDEDFQKCIDYGIIIKAVRKINHEYERNECDINSDPALIFSERTEGSFFHENENCLSQNRKNEVLHEYEEKNIERILTMIKYKNKNSMNFFDNDFSDSMIELKKNE